MPPLGFVQLGMLPLGVCLPAQHGNDSQSRAVTQALGAEALHTKPTSARAHELTVRRSVTVDRGTPHDEYIANASLDRIGSYATFYGPWKDDLAVQPADDALALPVSSGLCQRAQQRGLIVTPYTFRPEADQMAPVFHGIYFDEFRFFIRDIGVDGIWTDSASSVTEFYDAEELAGHQWSAGTLARLNQVQTSCKRPSSLDVEIAKQQYPQLDFSIHTPKG